jgi:hypothetical protein
MKSAIILAAVLLCGCASLPPGVSMDEQEKAACAAEGCTVWTVAELQRLAREFFQRGYKAGKSSL